MEILAYFEFFTGDFIVFGVLGTAAFIYKCKQEEDFWG
tara:strand:+ start:146 stop:259 length:114 start_codon:yes stop_codon:yes gene_type:complete